ncbi:MAG TPA: TetR/AcrR family transcriptional regulator [Acetobacteraceae bacterium]|nr:TetR/AcrR family transcriptional regulator [Acetobacteraceae bacterium]
MTQTPTETQTGQPAHRDVKTHIMDTAERLFAERGVAEVSVRDITGAAHVNVAAIAYHFGSREGLVRAVLERLSTGLNRERFALLDQMKEEANGAPLPVRSVLHAYAAPIFRWLDPASPRWSAGELVARFFAAPTPEMRTRLEHYVGHHQVFVAELRRGLPGLSEEDACWGFHFARGVMMQNTRLHLNRLRVMSEGVCVVSDPEALLHRAVDFAASGLEAWAAHGGAPGPV